MTFRPPDMRVYGCHVVAFVLELLHTLGTTDYTQSRLTQASLRFLQNTPSQKTNLALATQLRLWGCRCRGTRSLDLRLAHVVEVPGNCVTAVTILLGDSGRRPGVGARDDNNFVAVARVFLGRRPISTDNQEIKK
jgi:hypothetical protein